MFSLVNFVSFTFITKCKHVITHIKYINLVLTYFRKHVIRLMTILYWHGTIRIYKYLKRMQLTDRRREVTNYRVDYHDCYILDIIQN